MSLVKPNGILVIGSLSFSHVSPLLAKVDALIYSFKYSVNEITHDIVVQGSSKIFASLIFLVVLSPLILLNSPIL